MVKFFDPFSVKGLNFPALPTTYGEDLSYLEQVSRLCRMVNDLIVQCNLNTKDTNDILTKWSELIKLTDNGKNLIEELTALFNDKNVGFATTQDVIDVFNAQPSASYELATNPDIDNIF